MVAETAKVNSNVSSRILDLGFLSTVQQREDASQEVFQLVQVHVKVVIHRVGLAREPSRLSVSLALLPFSSSAQNASFAKGP